MRVPADLVTGFLGSGKTTLLRHVLRHGLSGQRVAVIVNDMAEVGIDARVIAADGLQNVETMVDLDNGCICCSIDLRFEYALQDIVDNLHPDLVLIESSGVADPRLLIDKLSQTSVALDAVITVVDAAHVERALEESEAARGQVAEADFLVVNKVDLIPEPDLDRIERCLRRLNSRAVSLRARFGQVDTPLLFGTSVRLYRQGAAACGDHRDGDDIESFTCESVDLLARDRFEAFLQRLPREIYRAKGIVHFAGESAASLFNFTCGRVALQWLPQRGAPPDRRNQGVFIGRAASRYRDGIADGFRGCGAAG